MFPAERDQFGGHIRARFDTRHQLHHGLDLFAQVLVRHAEHGGVGDLGVGDQQVFALLRIDVHPARDDHEGRPVGQIQEPVGVDVAHVPHRRHCAVGGSGFGRAARVLKILERIGHLEPQRSGLAGRTGLHFVVQHMQLAGHYAPDRAPVRQPLSAVTGAESHAFGGPIVFVDDRPPPVDHRLFHLGRAGGGGVDCDLQRRQVVAGPRLIGQLQHPREHRRHQLAVRDLIALDQAQILLGIEVFHDHHRSTATDGQAHSGLRCRVIERRGRQIDHPVAIPPKPVQK